MEKSERTPVKKPSKGGKRGKGDSNQILIDIQKSLKSHIGCPAILFVKESREMVPYFVELDYNGCVVAKHKCYAPDGSFRCFLNYHPSAVSIMTGEQRIIFFDEGI